MAIPRTGSLVPKKVGATVLWGVFLCFACPTLAVGHSNYDCPNYYLGCPSPFSWDSGPNDWNKCPELDGWTEQCHPTVSIEQAACLSPLVVFARVVTPATVSPALGLAQLQVRFQRPTNETDILGILKWGAGLDYDTLLSAGANFTDFTTWVSGFDDVQWEFSKSPCRTATPARYCVEDTHFFLQREEGDASPAIIDPETHDLSINFTLSTSVLSSGYLEGFYLSTGKFLWIKDGLAAEKTLEGDCDLLYCCYNPTCDAQDCPQRLQSAKDELGFECNWPTSGGMDWISSTFATFVVAGIVFAHSTLQMFDF